MYASVLGSTLQPPVKAMRESGDYRSPLRPAKDAGSYPATNEHSSASSETAAVRRESWSREGQVLESDGHAICILCASALGKIDPPVLSKSDPGILT